MLAVQSVTFGKIVAIDQDAGLLCIRTRMGESIWVECYRCETLELDVAVHSLNDEPFSVQSIGEWSEVMR